MRAFVVMLSVACLLPSLGFGADDTKTGADFAGPVLDRVAKMATAEQQVWLGRLEQRAARGARLTLEPEEAARQQARIAALLHQELVTWQVLREAIEETNRREREAIEVLARRYRSQVLDTFHKQLEVYDQRQEAWTAVYRDWTAAGADLEQQDRLIDWLEAAIRSASPERIGAIPEKPKFERARLPAEVAKRPTDAAKPQAAEKREELAKPQAAGKTARSESLAAPKEGLPAGSVQVNVEELTARIAGSNLGFRTLESELDEKGTWDAARLEPLAERLKILVIRHNDLSLFRELVPAEKRSSLGRLEGPRSAISELGARIFEARKLASGKDFSGTDAERQRELDRLDALSRRLAELDRK